MARFGFFWFGLILTLSVAAGMAQSTYHLPQVANGGGLIRTTFIAFNNGSMPATVALTLRDDAGGPLPLELSGLGTDSTHLFMLQPGETRFLQTTGQGPVQAGSAQAVSTAPIGISAIFSLLQPGGSVLTEAGVGVSAGLTEFVIAADSTGVFNTGIALQNLSGADNEVTFTFFDAQSADSAFPAGGAPRTTRTLPGQGHLSVFFSGTGGLFPQVGATSGALLIQAESPVAALTLRQGRSGSPLTTLPVVPTDSAQTGFVLPQVADGSGIRTQFILFGLGGGQPAGNGPANVGITLTDGSGAPFPVNLSNGESGSSFDLTLGASEAVFLETDGMGALRAGAARVTSDQPIGLTAVFSLLDEQGAITTEAGIGASPAQQAFTLPVDLTSGFDTGLALFNPGNAAANLTLQFFGEDGSTAEAATQLRARSGAWLTPQGGVGLSLGSLNQLARFVSQLISGLGEVRGQLAVTADRPVNALTLRQSRMTLTTLPVTPGISSPAPAGTDLLRSRVTQIIAEADVTVDPVLNHGFRLSGRATLPAGFFATSVVAIEAGGEVYTGGIDASGAYRVIVPAGAYDVRVCASGAAVAGAAGAGNEGSSLLFVGQAAEDVVVSGDTTRNFSVDPVATRDVGGMVDGMAALPSGAAIALLFADEANFRSMIAMVSPDGSYAAAAPPGTYEVALFFATGEDADFDGLPDDPESAGAFRGLGQLMVGEGAVDADFSVPNVSQVSGRISQPQTVMIPDAAGVFAIDTQNPFESFLEQCFPAAGAGFAPADADGNYGLLVAADRNYDVFANLPITAVGTDQQGVWSLPIPGTGNQNFGSDADLNFPFPPRPAIVTARGRVTDDGGEPVAGVDVSFATFGGVTDAAGTAFSVSTTTGADGRYEVQLLSGAPYTAVFTPPPPAP